MTNLMRPQTRPISDDEPFAADLLQRGDFFTALISAIESAESDSWVLGVEGAWGSGKTYFLEMFAKQASRQHAHWAIVRLDARKAESRQDPIVSFTKAILDATDKLRTTLSKRDETDYVRARSAVVDQAISFFKRVKSAATSSVPTVAGTAVTATVVSLGGGPVESTAAGAMTEEVLSDIVKDEIENPDDDGDAFCASLEDLVRSAKGPHKDRSPRVVIIVDDLDRCRPNYTISLIERMKHYFEIPGIVFVLAYDWNVLAQAARAAYSPELDADSYFRRIIDARFQLPHASADHVYSAVSEQLNISSRVASNNERHGREAFKYLLTRHADALTVRDWQQALVRMKFAWSLEDVDPLKATLLTYILVGRFLIRDEYRAPLDQSIVRKALERS